MKEERPGTGEVLGRGSSASPPQVDSGAGMSISPPWALVSSALKWAHSARWGATWYVGCLGLCTVQAVGQDIRFLYYLSIYATGASGRGRCLSALANYSLGVLEPPLLHMVLSLSLSFTPNWRPLSGLILQPVDGPGDGSIQQSPRVAQAKRKEWAPPP